MKTKSYLWTIYIIMCTLISIYIVYLRFFAPKTVCCCSCELNNVKCIIDLTGQNKYITKIDTYETRTCGQICLDEGMVLNGEMSEKAFSEMVIKGGFNNISIP